MKTCSNCILPEIFPGITFDSNDTCNFCQQFETKKSKHAEDKKKYEDKFLSLLLKLKGETKGAYDVLMAYSGGKDSTYTMALLKRKYNLRILAVSFDNGFISATSLKNINKVTDNLGIDHILFKPQWELLKKIFIHASENDIYSRKSLERASTICTSCIGLVKSICLKTAIEQHIPMIGFGWSPGQAPVQSSIMKNNPSFVKMAQNSILDPLQKIVGSDIEAYFLSDQHYNQPENFPYNVHPMAWEFYEEHMILDEIKKLGWEEPKDTDTNSSNCLINAFANEIHIARHGFHPYVWEIANMVREGVMSRDEGFNKIYQKQRGDLVNIAKEKLGISK